MRSRAVLLPTPCDPFLLKYWIENYRRTYKQYVDKLYVCMNSPIERQVVDYIQDMLDSVGANYIYIDHQIEHGDALRRLLEIVSEEYVMLVEDDSFVIKGDKIDQCFRYLESGEYDVVGGKRGSCSFEILERASELWGVAYEGEGDQGCNFWPNMFFCKTETLLKTDRHFEAKSWKKGDFIAPMNYHMLEDGCGDTFVNTSLELRGMNLRFRYEKQYHASPDDLEHFERGINLWDGFAPWVHIGSLSSGVSGMLTDDLNRPLAMRNGEAKEERKLEGCVMDEWARRLQMWQTFYDHSDPEKIPEFREEYRKAVERLYNKCGVSHKLVQRRQNCYKLLGL